MGFEEFSKYTRHFGEYVSVRSDRIKISVDVREEHFADTDHVRFYVDADDRLVALEPVDGDGANVYSLTDDGSISSRAITSEYPWLLGDDEDTVRYECWWDAEAGFLVFDANNRF